MQKNILGAAIVGTLSLTLLTACGSDNKAADTTPTPSVPTASAADIVINEVNSNAGDYDYIELYNKNLTAAYTFAAGEWGVRDNSLAADKDALAIPGGTVIPAGGFLTILTDNTTLTAGAPADSILSTGGKAKFGLGSADSAILLYKSTQHDRIDWTAHAKTD